MDVKINKLPAFTLAEMLIVLALIGILVAIAIPNFSSTISSAKAAEAKLQLSHLYNMQKQHHYMSSSFSIDMDKVNFEAPRTINNGGTANYSYAIIEASANTFKARAEAVVDFDGDGQINVWEIDENGVPKEITKD